MRFNVLKRFSGQRSMADGHVLQDGARSNTRHPVYMPIWQAALEGPVNPFHRYAATEHRSGTKMFHSARHDAPSATPFTEGVFEGSRRAGGPAHAPLVRGKTFLQSHEACLPDEWRPSTHQSFRSCLRSSEGRPTSSDGRPVTASSASSAYAERAARGAAFEPMTEQEQHAAASALPIAPRAVARPTRTLVPRYDVDGIAPRPAVRVCLRRGRNARAGCSEARWYELDTRLERSAATS